MSDMTLAELAEWIDGLPEDVYGGDTDAYTEKRMAATVRAVDEVLERCESLIHAQMKLAVCYRINKTPSMAITNECNRVEDVIADIRRIRGQK